MDLSIILGVISIIVGILPFFVEIDSKPLKISMRVFSIIIFFIFIILFFSMRIGFPLNLRATSTSDSLSDESPNIDINGDNNRVTVINGDNNQMTPSVETPIIDDSNEDKIEEESNEDVEDESTEIDAIDYNDMYIIHTINPEVVVKQNYDAIIQKKAEYTESDTLVFNSDFVYLNLYEQAGFIIFTKNENTQDVVYNMPLGGEFVTSAIVIFLDYETDNIIYTLVPDENGDVEYYPPQNKKFYYIVASSEYELYISEPILLSEKSGIRHVGIPVTLSKTYDTYSPQFQVRVNTCDTSKTFPQYTILPNEDITVYLVTKATNDHVSYLSFHYPFDTNDLGIITYKDAPCYFQLNNRYLMDIEKFGSEPITIDGLIKNTNIIDVIFEY